MATKNCPKCENPNPVACKKCACGHVFFTMRRSANVVAMEPMEEDPPQEPEIPRRRTARVTRERPQFYDALQVENQSRRQRELQKRRKASKSDDSEVPQEEIGSEKPGPSLAQATKKRAESPPRQSHEPPAKKRRGRPPGLSSRKSSRVQILASKTGEQGNKAADGGIADESMEDIESIHDVTPMKALQMSMVLSDINSRICSSSMRADEFSSLSADKTENEREKSPDNDKSPEKEKDPKNNESGSTKLNAEGDSKAKDALKGKEAKKMKTASTVKESPKSKQGLEISEATSKFEESSKTDEDLKSETEEFPQPNQAPKSKEIPEPEVTPKPNATSESIEDQKPKEAQKLEETLKPELTPKLEETLQVKETSELKDSPQSVVSSVLEKLPETQVDRKEKTQVKNDIKSNNDGPPSKVEGEKEDGLSKNDTTESSFDGATPKKMDGANGDVVSNYVTPKREECPKEDDMSKNDATPMKNHDADDTLENMSAKADGDDTADTTVISPETIARGVSATRNIRSEHDSEKVEPKQDEVSSTSEVVNKIEDSIAPANGISEPIVDAAVSSSENDGPNPACAVSQA